MRFSDLTKDQRLEFKQRILIERNEVRGEGTSYGEVADADRLVSDEDAESHAEGVEFSPDDFSCGVAADRDGVLDELKEWAERILRTCVFAHDHPLSSGVNTDTINGIEWARQRLLDHIEAVRP